jgi:Carboxypeptidase regulatory-like domain/TonB dependent receptor
MKVTKLVFVLAAIVLAMADISTASAQAGGSAQVSGMVTDASGAVIPKAEISITQTFTHLVRTTTSDGTGFYVIPALPVGTYELRASMSGFNVSVQSGIELQVDDHRTVNVTLQLGSVSESVQVAANVARIDSTSSSIQQVIDQQRVEELPLNGRDPIQLALLSGGSAVPGGQSTSFNGGRAYPEAYQIAFAGQSAATGTFILDGVNHNDPGTNIQFPFPFPDALQEFNVQISAAPAKFGMHSGGVVDAVTKSGDNGFHGDLFEYVRNYIFNAKNYFALTRDNLKRNQFGGTIGGPIIKNKLFFFTAFQYTVTRSASSTNTSFIPTTDMLAGNFQTASTAGCFKGSLGGPFTANHISPSQLSTPAVNLANLLLKQTSPSDACGTVRYAIEANSNTPMSISKIDYHINDKHTLTGRYMYTTFVHPLDTSLLLASTTSGQDIRFQSVSLGETWLISPKLINVFTLGLNRSRDNRSEGEDLPTPTDLGVQGYYNPTPKYIIVSVPSFFSLVGAPGSGPAYFNVTTPQFSEQFTWVEGKHQFVFGMDWDYFLHNSGEPAYANGAFNFSSSFTNYALSDFLVGDLASTSNQTNEVFVDIKKPYFGLFAQDSWKMNPKLTLNYGIRWEPGIPWTWIRNTTIPSHFEPASFRAGIHSQAFPLAPAGLTFPGDVGYPDHSASFSNFKQFSPRLGLSYDPTGSGRLVVKLSYGIFYDFDSTGQYYDVGTSPPSGMQINFPVLTGGFTNPWAGFTFNGKPGNPFPLPSTGAFPTSGSYLERPLHQPSLYSQHWNVGLQQQFGSDWLLSASYVGNTTTHIMFPGEANPGVYSPPGTCGLPNPATACTTTANISTRRLLYTENATQGVYFAQVIQMQDDSNAAYNGLILTVQKHLSHGINWLANYTFSHCIDQYELGSALVASVWRNPFGRQFERGNCTYDRRHNFNTSAVLQAPRLGNAVARTLITGWQLAPIVTIYSGDWLTVSTGADSALMGIPAGQRPNVTCNPKLSNRTIQAWFNTSCFSVPTVPAGFTGNVVPSLYSATGTITVGPIGNLGRNTLEGPGAWNFDLSLSRTFKVYEDTKIQFRAEAFNVFNHTRYPDPIVTMNSSTFGQITTPTAEVNGASAPQDPRIMQFALKYIF